MDLWIRSQDGEVLTKVNNLWMSGNTIWYEIPFYTESKRYGLSVTGHNHKIATYKTKKRALEVLDEIQIYLEAVDDVPQMVYEMPKE